MDHQDHVNLLRPGLPAVPGIWADFGAGRGAFTLALADLLPSGSTIHAIDRDRRALQENGRRIAASFPAITFQPHVADFTRPLDLPPLDGLVIANALHFIQHKEPVIHLLSGYLRPGGRFILIEYNTDRGNPWVPHPLSFTTWTALAERSGLQGTQLLATHPSSFLGSFYAALSFL